MSVPSPAIVAMVPSGAMRRTRPLPRSAISTDPSAVRMAHVGRSSRAATAGPPSPAKPVRPLPARSVRVPGPFDRKTWFATGSAQTRCTPVACGAQAGSRGGVRPGTTATPPFGPSRTTRWANASVTRMPPVGANVTDVGPRRGYVAAVVRSGATRGSFPGRGTAGRSSGRQPRSAYRSTSAAPAVPGATAARASANASAARAARRFTGSPAAGTVSGSPR